MKTHHIVVVSNQSGLQCKNQFLIVNLRTEPLAAVKDTDRRETTISFKKRRSMVSIRFWTPLHFPKFLKIPKALLSLWIISIGIYVSEIKTDRN